MPNFKDLLKKSNIDRTFLTSVSFGIICIIGLSLLVWIIIKQTISQVPTKKVSINKNGLSNEQHLQLNTALLPTTDGHYLTTDLLTIKEAAMSLPWVDEVSVFRDWHNGIVVNVLPKKAVARFGSTKLVDASGDVFYPAHADTLLSQDFVTLEGATDKSTQIMKQMQLVNQSFAPLDMSVKDMILTPRMTWLIRFDSGMRILVDGEDTSYKLLNASNVLKTQLYDRHNEIQSIDLRYKNGFAISWK